MSKIIEWQGHGIDPNAIETLLARVADEIILPRFGNLSADQIQTKSSPTDLVTQVDIEAEAMMRAALGDIAPGIGFIGEEAAACDPSIVRQIEGKGAFWVLDPLDGTRNFVHGKEEFGTILALVIDGRTEGGWIYAPMEHGCATAIRGRGVTWNRQKIPASVPLRDDLGQLVGSRSVGWLNREWSDKLTANLRANTSSRGAHCSAYAYLNLLRGDSAFGISSRVHPWDHAAGALMVTEAGGRVEFLDNEQAYSPLDSADRPLLKVACQESLDEIKRALRGDTN
ncbi:MAG: inositol monophosphatase [Parvularculaceae bacterium]|nr:MAG: inositol monophosphatase [Parvularculaceae bacterium]